MRTRVAGKLRHGLISMLRWLDSGIEADAPVADEQRVDWLRVLPFIFLHLACLGVIWVGFSPFALGVAIALYLLRMFAITAFYHRYFSHRTFRTSRPWQFLFALLGASAAQRGPLWWAAHHRLHHAHSDRPEDVHSPKQHGLTWSHVGWLTSAANFRTRTEVIPDLVGHPELRFLDRFDTLIPVVLAALGYCEAGFAEHYLGDVQVLLAKPGNRRDLPLLPLATAVQP